MRRGGIVARSSCAVSHTMATSLRSNGRDGALGHLASDKQHDDRPDDR
jgi:hypothetical protein